MTSIGRAVTPTFPAGASSTELQTRLWHLLQTRKWPTTALEPLDCDDVDSFNQHGRGQELLFDSHGDSDGLSCGTRARENDDMEMLETGIDYPGRMDYSDENLFSSYENTPDSSQDTMDDDILLWVDDSDDLLPGVEPLLSIIPDSLDQGLGAYR